MCGSLGKVKTARVVAVVDETLGQRRGFGLAEMESCDDNPSVIRPRRVSLLRKWNEKEQRPMPSTHARLRFTSLILILLALGTGLSLLQPGVAQSGTKLDLERLFLLPDDRIVMGTVQHVISGVIQVNIGELMPLYLSVEAASEKGIGSLKSGDKLKLVINDENEVVDFHRRDGPGWDVAVKGRLLQPLIGDLKWAVLQTDLGTNEPFEVAEDARHKVQNIPVGVPALFLLNGHDIIVDATVGNERALLETLAQWSKDRQRMIRP